MPRCLPCCCRVWPLRSDIHGLVSPIPRAAGYLLSQKFDVCACFSVLHLLQPKDRVELVRYAAGQLRPDGKLVLHMPVPSTSLTAKPWSMAGVRNFGAITFEQHTAVELGANGQWHTHWKFRVLHDAEVLEEVAQSFQWSPLGIKEFDSLLAAQGLVIDEEFGAFDRSPFVPNQSRVRLIVAHRA
jgi:SAM-dependent methyltransferase